MQLQIKMLLMIAALVAMTNGAEARGGGGGRGGGGARVGGGGGAYRGGHVMNRTPAMNRASYNPQLQQVRPQVQQARTQIQQARPQVQQARPQIQQARPEVQQALQASQQRPQSDRQAIEQRQQTFSSQRPNQISSNKQISQNVSQRLSQTRPGYNNLFNSNFFQNHNLNPAYAQQGFNGWGAAGWGTLQGWGGWNWSYPYYYGYEGYPVQVAPSQYGYSQPAQTAQPVPATPAASGKQTAQSNWLPLGIFAVGSDANEAALANRFLQLTLNRNGEIAGTYYNSARDEAHTITGTVDPDTQKAYWALSDKAGSPVASTGLYNLTENQTPINVHFTDGSDQTWTLVRLQENQ